jgi:hypothetical protein
MNLIGLRDISIGQTIEMPHVHKCKMDYEFDHLLMTDCIDYHSKRLAGYFNNSTLNVQGIVKEIQVIDKANQTNEFEEFSSHRILNENPD